jgi:signal peptidase I
VDQEKVIVEDEQRPDTPEFPQPEPPRGFVAEWTVTIILLLFGTTNLVQAFVIPTGSMEDTLLIGDHLLVDKLAYSPPGPASKYILPYSDVKRGDIIVFRYPVDIQQTLCEALHWRAAIASGWKTSNSF